MSAPPRNVSPIVDANLAEWQEILEAAMRFATNCAEAYARASAPTKRRFNQAVFTRIEVCDGKIAAVGYHRRSTALFRASSNTGLVEVMGLEPTTSTLQRSHSSQLSYTPVRRQAATPETIRAPPTFGRCA